MRASPWLLASAFALLCSLLLFLFGLAFDACGFAWLAWALLAHDLCR